VSPSRAAPAAPARQQDGSTALDPGLRREAEQFFRASFADVRIHTGPAAAASVATARAAAVTVGRDVLLRPEAYRPRTTAGRFLLVHELTHAVQQRGGTASGGAPGQLPRAAERHEAEADAAADAFVTGGPLPAVTAGPVSCACRGPLPPPTVRRAVRVPSGQRYGTPPSTLPELAERMRQRNQVADVQALNSVPTATLRRGGSPPDFITERQELHMWAWGNAYITRRTLHILDKIEYQVLRADSAADVQRVVRAYIPELAPAEQPASARGPLTLALPPSFDLPPGVDDDGRVRLQVLLEALQERNRQAQQRAGRVQEGQPAERPLPAPAPSAPDVDQSLAGGHSNRRGCLVEPVAQQFGRHFCHAAYARRLSGVSREVRVETPDGLTRTFDGLGAGGILYEVKTGYRFLLNTSPSTYQRRLGVLHRWIEQSEDQAEIARRCGYRLEWHLNERAVADLVDGLLQVPVYYTPFDCDVDSTD